MILHARRNFSIGPIRRRRIFRVIDELLVLGVRDRVIENFKIIEPDRRAQDTAFDGNEVRRGSGGTRERESKKQSESDWQFGIHAKAGLAKALQAYRTSKRRGKGERFRTVFGQACLTRRSQRT